MSNASGVSFTTTARVRDHCLCLHVQRAARALARRFDDALRPLGLTHGQFSLLMSINRPLPPSLGAVAALLAMDRTTLTAAVKPLARRGLVKLAMDPTDHRTRLLSLTRSGRILLVSALPVWERIQMGLESLLGSGRGSRLRDTLRTLS